MSKHKLTTDVIAGQIQQALALIHQGLLPQAEATCRQVLALQPGNFNASQLLGHIALQQRDYAGAAKWLGAAIAVNPSSAAVCSNLAVALLALRRPRESLECCDRAIALNALFPEGYSNRGNALCALGRPEEGLASYDRAVSLAPILYDAHVGRISALQTLQRYEEALISCDRALQIAPNSADAWSSRGVTLLKLHRSEEALAAFDRALSLSPEFAEALNNRGTVLRNLRQPLEAIASYERALMIRPNFPEALCNMANIRLDSGRFAEAIGYCDRALSIQPNLVDAFNIRGAALRFLNRYAEAAEAYGKLLALAPRFDYALSHLFFLRASLCDWSDRAEQSAEILASVEAGERASAPHTFLSISESPAAQLQCARTFVANFPALTPLWLGERYRHERIRVAYLSADFHDHPVAHLIAGVLERHDRSRFETFGVSLRREAGSEAMHRRMQQAFEHFHDVTDVSDRDVATLLRQLEIDIAIDLNTHTRGGRLGILAYRPAPVQVNYLGFAGSSGTSVIDYLIADGVAIPSEHERFFSERIVRLPHSFLPNDDRQPIARELPRRQDLGLPEAGFVFCGFNTTYKLNPAMFDIWMRLLKETPGSVLWLRSGELTMLANLTREAVARGVAPERLVFAPKVPAMAEHLARYRQADLFLDTLPYGAHATARDALWAGLPVLTCAGSAFASRVAGSLLAALGLDELVTSSLEEYEMRALQLASSPGLLAEIRSKLAHQQRTCPVFDTDLFRQHLESAYRTMWERAQTDETPGSFSVPAIR